MAHTLLSTRPVGNATARMVSSTMSVGTPDDRFGHAIHNPPAAVSFGRQAAIRATRSARFVTNTTITSQPSASRVPSRTPVGNGPRANPVGPPRTTTRCPSLIPSFCGRGVPEYPVAIPGIYPASQDV